MKLVIAAMSHETNSFSPVPTALAGFGVGAGPSFGAAALALARGTRMPMGAFIDIAERRGDEIVTPVVARHSPSAPVDDEAYRVITEAILETIAAGCDAVLLDLHGAMITQSLDDGEGALLERIRAIAPGLPIGVALDFHANVTRRMVENATVMVGYKTYPHVDMYETGVAVADLLFGTMEGRIRPVMRCGNAPMLPHTLRMDTGEPPAADLIALVRELERGPSILAASLFGGFPLADTREAGLSAIVVADEDADAAERSLYRLLAAAWSRRQEFLYDAEPLAQSIARAKAIGGGPVLLIDHADNCNSGGTLDSMTVVEEAMRQGLAGVAVAPLCDPEAASLLHQAGLGATVTLDLGEKTPTPAIRRTARPLRLTGRVTALSDGFLTVTGPVFTGTRLGMGKAAAFDTGDFVFVVTSRRIEPYDLGVFRSLGIEPTAKRYLILKSRIQYKPAFQPIATATIECNGVGVASSDYALFDFARVRRPIFPLDPDTTFVPQAL